MEEIYWFWLSKAFDMDAVNMNLLLDEFYSPKEIFMAKEKTLKNLGINQNIVNKIIRSKDEKELIIDFEKLSKLDVKFTHFGLDEFPDFEALGCVRPRVLFYRGNLPKNDEEIIAMVGARKCSLYGQNMSFHLAGEAAEMGLSVVSGLALGIDRYSHEGALNKNGKTYAVLACGPEKCYPTANKYLYDRILESGGGIISEYPPETEPIKIRFPLRNRIISGLSRKLIIVEARKKSGSLITASCGLEQGKDIYAVPGRAGDSLSEGCNELIKEGAGLITNISDMYVQENFIFSKKTENKPDFQRCADDGKEKNINMGLEKDLQVLYSNVHWRPESIEEIARNSDVSVTEAIRGIAVLQLKGLVKEVMRNYYSKA